MVRYPYLVGIGKAQHHTQLPRILTEAGTRSEFAAYQTGRLTDTTENVFEMSLIGRFGQRLSEPARATTRLVETGAPFAKYRVANAPIALVAE